MTEDTLDRRVMPPSRMTKTRTATMRPTSHSGTWNVLFSAVEIEFACVMLPIPNDAMTAKMANSIASTVPKVLFLRPRFMVVIGPPSISPASLVVRYLMASIHSENLLVRPKIAEISIQTSAPGPPLTNAVATPTMLPVPMVAASAVISAANGEISPVPRCVPRASLLNTECRAYGRLRQVANPMRTVRKMPVPTRSTSMTGPHTKLSTAETMLENVSIMFDSLLIIPHEAETLRKRKKDRQRRERDVFVYLLLRGI